MQHQPRLVFHGRLSTLFAIWFSNLLLFIVTIGVHSFWGKVKIRKYMLQNLSFDGDYFEYNGTGTELFRGYARIIFIYFITFFILGLFIGAMVLIPSEDVRLLVKITNGFIQYFLFFYLGYAAYFSSMRYRFSRISWRGIRGYVEGSIWDYASFRLWRLILNIASLGFTIPQSDLLARHYLVTHSQFGSAKGQFANFDSRPLWKVNIISWLLFIPTLSLSRCWYRAAFLNYSLSLTAYDNIHFRGSYTGAALAKERVIIGLVIAFTLGLGWALVLKRRMELLAHHTIIEGRIEDSLITQAPVFATKSAEGLEAVFGEAEMGAF